jgi:hypothetical protein
MAHHSRSIRPFAREDGDKATRVIRCSASLFPRGGEVEITGSKRAYRYGADDKLAPQWRFALLT